MADAGNQGWLYSHVLILQVLSYVEDMTTNIDRHIIPAEFPQLKQLAWNRDVTRPIPADEAFALYERNWRFVDTEHLGVAEADLIRDLTKRFGNGIMLVS